ncbi:MAG: family 10 glycosylhydrolase [Cyclobacteriaceae bacterium]
MKITRLLILNLCFFISATAVLAQAPKREFRAVWIATVKNIDWPSVPGLTTEEQKDEYRKILDYHELNGMNAVIMQVRPSSDAFYQSDIEPWSRYLTGVSGQAPDTYYDPLTFMIDEAHDRGMEFHAWFNPYRAIVDMEEFPEDSTNIFYEKPEWFVQYGSRIYFDPGIPEVKTYTTEVIKDVVQRYDIDAVHFDDYFYPYRIAGVEFPDSVSFRDYGGEYTLETKDDWRRQNVNTVIQMLSDTIKSVKPWVKFGISPFGVWRNIADDPRGSDSRAGQTNYDDLFADVLLWMDRGWIDYILPQLYLHIGHPLLDFDKVLHWWNDLDYSGHLYAGYAAYRVGNSNEDSVWMNPSELPNQIRMTRKLSNALGGAHFSSKSLMNNPLGISDSLRRNLYSTKALVPTMPWLDDEAPKPPTSLFVNNETDGVFIDWKPSDSTARYYVIYRFEGKKIGDFQNGENILAIQRANTTFYKDVAVRKRKKYTYAISALDRLSNESEPTPVRFIKVTKKNPE